MSRPLRIEYPGALYHVTARGNERKDIYASEYDYRKFIEYIEKAFKKFKIIIHAFCLMINHYHLLLETRKANLSRCMHYINSCYSAYYNRKSERAGHLFQGRYKAILVEEDSYLIRLSQYIHLNPVRAGIVESPGMYPWSSYRYFIGDEKPPVFLETETGLSYFDSREAYKNFVEEGMVRKVKNPLSEAFAGAILGSDRFVAKIRSGHLKNVIKDGDVPGLGRLKRMDISPEGIIRLVDLENGLEEKESRKLKMFFLRKYTEDTLKAIADRIFDKEISVAAVSQMISRLESRATEDEKLGAIMKRMETKILGENVKC